MTPIAAKRSDMVIGSAVTTEFLQHARLGKCRAPRAVAGYKRSSVALLLLRLPGWDNRRDPGKATRSPHPGAKYGVEANRDAKNRKAQRACDDRSESNGQNLSRVTGG